MDEMNNNVPQQAESVEPVQVEYTMPQQGEYTQPTYDAPVEEKKSNTLGIISLICGIATIVFTCCCGWISFPAAIAAIILAVVEKNKNGQMSTLAKVGMGLAIAGIVLAVVSIIFSMIVGGISGFLGALTESSYDSYYYY